MSSEAQRRLILHISVSLDGFSAAGRDIPGSVDHGSVRHQARLINALPKGVLSTSLAAVDWQNAGARRGPIALGGGSALMHGLPEPQRFELVSSTVYTDGSTVQVLRPGGRDG